MRRPAQTKKQKQHAREQRALLRLRRAAVRWSMLSESMFEAAKRELPFAFAELGAACDAYSNALTARDQRKLGLKIPEDPEVDEHDQEEQLELVPIAGTSSSPATREVELHLSDGRVLVVPDMPTRKAGNR